MQLKLQGATAGREGQLSVATEVSSMRIFLLEILFSMGIINIDVCCDIGGSGF